MFVIVLAVVYIDFDVFLIVFGIAVVVISNIVEIYSGADIVCACIVTVVVLSGVYF